MIAKMKNKIRQKMKKKKKTNNLQIKSASEVSDMDQNHMQQTHKFIAN